MHPEVVAALACPHDGGRLSEDAGVLGCPRGHRFDLARQGYASLTAGRPSHAGDSPAMLERRMRVHEAGILEAVHAAVVEAAAGDDHAAVGAAATGDHAAVARTDAPRKGSGKRSIPPAGIVCEVGAGPGTYLAAVLDAMPDRAGLAVDIAKAAARRAARCHPRASAVVADVWDGLPLRAGSVAVLLDVFAPRNTAEFTRIVAPGGTLVVAAPEPDHLAELRARFGMLEVPGGKSARIVAELAPGFIPRAVRTIRTVVPVARSLAVDLAMMGPSGHHLDPEHLHPEHLDPGHLDAEHHGAPAAAADPDEAAIPVTIAVTVTRFERRAEYAVQH